MDKVLVLINLFFGGMLAGMEFVVHYGIHKPSVELGAQPQLAL